ncbi:sigma 54-interacting transcriptional regulator [Vibrio sp. PP-XX7]
MIKVDCVSHIDEAKQLRTSYHYDLMVLDLYSVEQLPAHQLTDFKYLDTQFLLSIAPAKVGIIMTTLKLRGYDFILQPFHREQVFDVVNRCIVTQLEKQRALVLHQEAKKHLLATTLIGNSEKTKYLRQLIKQYASSKAAVLVEGEPRTGKELVARAIHAASERVGPFVSVNCAEWNEALLRSENFWT